MSLYNNQAYKSASGGLVGFPALFNYKNTMKKIYTRSEVIQNIPKKYKKNYDNATPDIQEKVLQIIIKKLQSEKITVID